MVNEIFSHKKLVNAGFLTNQQYGKCMKIKDQNQLTNSASKDSSEHSLHLLSFISCVFVLLFHHRKSIANKPPKKKKKKNGWFTSNFNNNKTENNPKKKKKKHHFTPSKPPIILGAFMMGYMPPFDRPMTPRCIWSLLSSVSTAKVDMPPTEPLRVASCSEYKDVTRRFEEPAKGIFGKRKGK